MAPAPAPAKLQPYDSGSTTPLKWFCVEVHFPSFPISVPYCYFHGKLLTVVLLRLKDG